MSNTPSEHHMSQPTLIESNLSEEGSVRVASIKEFLSQRDRDKLFQAICDNTNVFTQYLPGTDDQRATQFLSMSTGTDDPNISESLSQAIRHLSSQIMEVLPSLFKVFEIAPFDISQFEWTLTNSFHGDDGLPHIDRSHRPLKMSLVYYLRRATNTFSGGDLLFYETDVTATSGHKKNHSIKIDHVNNLLIAFPSSTYHSVTKIHSYRSEFIDGRFAMVGFIGPDSDHFS